MIILLRKNVFFGNYPNAQYAISRDYSAISVLKVHFNI